MDNSIGGPPSTADFAYDEARSAKERIDKLEARVLALEIRMRAVVGHINSEINAKSRGER